MKRKFLIILLAIVCAVNCVTMFSACGDNGNLDNTGNNSSVTDQAGDSNDDGSGENSETPVTPENPESGDEDNDNPTTPNTPEDDGKGVTGSTDSDTGETGKPDTPETGNTPNTGDAEEKQDEYIYTKENGWNTQLLAKTLEDWMIENDYYEIYTDNMNAHMEKLLFFDNLDNDKITFTILLNNNGTKYIHNLKIRDSLLSSITTQNNYNVNQLIKALNATIDTSTTQTPRREILGNTIPIKLEYSSLDEDFDSHKEEFKLLSDRIFERAEKIGVQNYKGVDGKKVLGLKSDNVFFAAKGETTSSIAGLGIGDKVYFYSYYLIKDGNEYKWIESLVQTSIDDAPEKLYFVKKDAVNDNWLLTTLDAKAVYNNLNELAIF